MKIYKFEVPMSGEVITYNAPFRRVLTAQIQGDKVMVWAELLDGIDKEHPVENTNLHFVLIGTGWEIPDDFLLYWTYIGTVQKDGFVWHVYCGQSDPEIEESGTEENSDDEHKPTEEA